MVLSYNYWKYFNVHPVISMKVGRKHRMISIRGADNLNPVQLGGGSFAIVRGVILNNPRSIDPLLDDRACVAGLS